MATICGKISADLLVDCTNPLISGVNDRMVLINREDWELATITVNITDPRIITNIVLASGVTAYEYQGKNDSIEPKSTLVRTTYSEAYDHEITFKVFINNADTKKQLELLAKGKVVAIIQNNHTGTAGNACFEVYGVDSGLILQTSERSLADADTQGAYACVLRNSEKSRQAHFPYTFFDTSFAVTKAKVDALL